MSNDPIGPNVEVLQQTLALLARLDDEQYCHVESSLSSASIGAHVRHNLDHYRLFLAGLPAGVVDYDARERDTLVERDRLAAVEAIHELIAALRALPARLAPRRVRVHQQGSYQPGRFDGCESNVERELLFLQSHTVHHHALIALLVRAQGLPLPESFGMAPSTLSWLAEHGSVTASASGTSGSGATLANPGEG